MTNVIIPARPAISLMYINCSHEGPDDTRQPFNSETVFSSKRAKEAVPKLSFQDPSLTAIVDPFFNPVTIFCSAEESSWTRSGIRA